MQPVEDARKEYIIFIEGILSKYGTTDPGLALANEGIPFEETMMIEIYGDKALFFTKRGDEWVFTIIKQRTIPHPNIPSRMLGTKEAFIADLRRGIALSIQATKATTQ